MLGMKKYKRNEQHYHTTQGKLYYFFEKQHSTYISALAVMVRNDLLQSDWEKAEW